MCDLTYNRHKSRRYARKLLWVGLPLFRFFFLIFFLSNGVTNTSYSKPIVIDGVIEYSMPIGKYLDIAEDPHNAAFIEQLISGNHDLRFTPTERDSPKFGITDATFWIKIEIINQEKQSKTLYLENRYALLDKLELYTVASDGSYQVQAVGDKLSFKSRPVAYRYPIFKLDLAPGENTFFLKINTHGSVYLGLYLWEPENFLLQTRWEYTFIGGTIGFQLIMTIYYLIMSLKLKKSLFFNLSMYVISLVVVQMGFLGASMEWFPHRMGVWLSNEGFLLFVALAGNLGCLFATQFLNMRDIVPRLFSAYMGVIAFGFMLMIAVKFVDYSIMAKVINGYCSLISVAIIFAGFKSWLKGFDPAKAYIIPWAFDTVVIILMALKLEGYLPLNFLTEWGLIIGNTAKILLISFSLVDRYNFQAMKSKDRIDNLNTELKRHIEEIEQIVQERTERIRMITDNVKSGFLLIDHQLLIQEGFTKSCHMLFGKNLRSGKNILDYLDLDKSEKLCFQMAVEQVFDDLMPEQASLNQIPKTLLVGAKYLGVSGAVIRDQRNKISSILFTVSDKTELRFKEEESRENGMLLRIISNHSAFKAFIKTFKETLDWLKNPSQKIHGHEVKQVIHTLKGNAMIFGLTDVAKLLHVLEEKKSLNSDSIKRVEKQIKSFLHKHVSILKTKWEGNDEVFPITASELKALKEKNHIHGVGKEYLDIWIDNSMSKSITSILGPIREDLSYLAHQLAKKVKLKIVGDDLRIYSEKSVYMIQSLIHLLRNAVIHGIEEDRKACGKHNYGAITLIFSKDEATGTIKICCEDDGRGISLPEGFTDIVTYFKTKTSKNKEADLFSGRHIGVAAVLTAIDEIGGHIYIESHPGQGTKFMIEFSESWQRVDKVC